MSFHIQVICVFGKDCLITGMKEPGYAASICFNDNIRGSMAIGKMQSGSIILLGSLAMFSGYCLCKIVKCVEWYY